MTDYPADHILASLSALRCLSEAPEGYVTGAPFLLAQALSCPYTIILPPENPAGDHFVHALHMASNASPIDEKIVVRMARSLIGLNNTNCNDWSGTCPSGALGHHHFRGQSCRDGNGAVSAYLFAFSRQSLDDNEFAETLMDLMAPRIGRDMERDIGRTATPKKEAGNLPEAILEAVPAAITLRDTDGRFTFVNKWGAGLYNISQRDIIGKTQSEVFGASSTTHYVEELARTVTETGETINNAEIVSKSSAGQAFSLCIAPVFNSTGRVDGVVTVAQDITESKRAETALKESEQALAEAQRIGRIGHWRIDGGRGIMSMSKEAYRALGYDAGDDERTLEVIRAAVHPDDLETLEEARNWAIENKKPYEFKYRITRPDGEVRVMAGEGLPEYDENG